MSEKDWPDDLMTPAEVADEMDELLRDGGPSVTIGFDVLNEWRSTIAQCVHVLAKTREEGENEKQDDDDG